MFAWILWDDGILKRKKKEKSKDFFFKFSVSLSFCLRVENTIITAGFFFLSTVSSSTWKFVVNFPFLDITKISVIQ